MKRPNRNHVRRALAILVFAAGVAVGAAHAQIDGTLLARSTHGDSVDLRFAAGTLLGVTVAWAEDGCGGAADVDLVLCPNCPDAVFLQHDRLVAHGDILGAGTYAFAGEFRSDGATGTLRVTGVTGCPADHTITWAVGNPTVANRSDESTAIAPMTWAAVKLGRTPR